MNAQSMILRKANSCYIAEILRLFAITVPYHLTKGLYIIAKTILPPPFQVSASCNMITPCLILTQLFGLNFLAIFILPV